MLKQVIHHLLLPLSPALFFIILFTINMLHIPYSSQPTNHPTCNKRIYTCTIGTKKKIVFDTIFMYVRISHEYQMMMMMMIFFYSIYLSAHIYRSCLVTSAYLLNEFNVHRIKLFFFTANLAMPQNILYFIYYFAATSSMLTFSILKTRFSYHLFYYFFAVYQAIQLMLLLILSCISFNEKKSLEMNFDLNCC